MSGQCINKTVLQHLNTKQGVCQERAHFKTVGLPHMHQEKVMSMASETEQIFLAYLEYNMYNWVRLLDRKFD